MRSACDDSKDNRSKNWEDTYGECESEWLSAEKGAVLSSEHNELDLLSIVFDIEFWYI